MKHAHLLCKTSHYKNDIVSGRQLLSTILFQLFFHSTDKVRIQIDKSAFLFWQGMTKLLQKKQHTKQSQNVFKVLNHKKIRIRLTINAEHPFLVKGPLTARNRVLFCTVALRSIPCREWSGNGQEAGAHEDQKEGKKKKQAEWFPHPQK